MGGGCITYAILLAAGLGTRMRGVTRYPKPLLPLNGGTVMSDIIEELKRHGIQDIEVVVHHEEQLIRSYLEEFRSQHPDVQLHVVRQPELNGPGGAVLAALRQKGSACSIVCADTVFRVEDLGLDRVWTKGVSNPREWCVVDTDSDGLVTTFVNKPLGRYGPAQGLIGLYTLSDDRIQQLPEKKSLEISDVLQASGRRFRVEQPLYWGDCGQPTNYLRTRREVFYSRGFNGVRREGTKILKRGPNVANEYRWYADPNNPWRGYIPRAKLYGEETLELDYFPFSSVSDLYLFDAGFDLIPVVNKLTQEIWDNCYRKPESTDKENLYQMYYRKTSDRLEDARISLGMHYSSEVWIDGVAYKNPANHLALVADWVRQYQTELGFIHGDMVLSNILYSKDHDAIRLVDPRGNFGHFSNSMYFDYRYDLAKLWQCIGYGYDFVNNGLYTWDEEKILLHRDPAYQEIADKLLPIIDNDVLRIVALQFLSMTALHKDRPKNADLMYRIGTKLFWEVFGEDE